MKQTLMQYLMVALMVVGAYFIGVYKTENTYLKQGGSLAANNQQQPTGDVPAEKTELTDDEWATAKGKAVGSMGEKNAKVVIVEWTDYQCPFCKRYIDETYSQIKTKYVDTGKVLYEVRDLILPFHPNAKPAAVAARCAAQEGKFLEMHDKLFAEQEIWSVLTDTKAKFAEYASSFGIAASKWDACVADPKIAAAVEEDTKIASQLGASGTPTFMINGKIVVGAQPYQVFEQQIEEALK